jgi:hypothetical protein
MAGQACNDNKATINATRRMTISAADCVICRKSQSVSEPMPSAERMFRQEPPRACGDGLEIMAIKLPV